MFPLREIHENRLRQAEKWRPAWPPLKPEVIQHNEHWEKSYRVSKSLKIPCRGAERKDGSGKSRIKMVDWVSRS